MIDLILAALRWLFVRGELSARMDTADRVSRHTGLTRAEVEAAARKRLEGERK